MKRRWYGWLALGAVLVGHLVHIFALPVLIGSAFLAHSDASHAVINWILWGATVLVAFRTIARWKRRVTFFRV